MSWAIQRRQRATFFILFVLCKFGVLGFKSESAACSVLCLYEHDFLACSMFGSSKSNNRKKQNWNVCLCSSIKHLHHVKRLHWQDSHIDINKITFFFINFHFFDFYCFRVFTFASYLILFRLGYACSGRTLHFGFHCIHK